MYTISPKAYRALEADAEREFVTRLGKVLREAVPTLAAEQPAMLHNQIDFLIQQARGYGLESEQAIGGFAVTAGLLGLDFATRFPGAQQILSGSESGNRKAELLEAFTLILLEKLES